MMRIAIAGGGRFALVLAHAIGQTANAVIVLSRSEHPEFQDCQVVQVDFDDQNNLRYTLQGVDLLISTISGREQLSLIDAARKARVRLFVPSEFEGALAHRPTNDPLDSTRWSAAALEQLRHWAQSRSYPMQWTVFSCGILYERFMRGGLGAWDMGDSHHIPNQGDYLVDVGSGYAEVVETNSQGRAVQVCMTSLADVAKFVAAAIEMGPANWPREWKMRGDRMTIRDIISACEEVRGARFQVQTRSHNELGAHIAYYQENEDWSRYWYTQRLLATADGRYDFRSANLNQAVEGSEHVDVEPTPFRQWLEMTWGDST